MTLFGVLLAADKTRYRTMQPHLFALNYARMKFEIVPAYDLSSADQAKTFSAAFAGYVGGSFELTPATLVSFSSLQGIDVCFSRFARNSGGELVSFGYIS